MSALHPGAPALCALCAAPIPARGAAQASLDGVVRDFCCHGCAAVATLAATLRGSDIPPEPAGMLDDDRSAYRAYDDEALAGSLVFRRRDGLCEVGLAVHGIHCAACETIIGRALAELDGVREVHVDVLRRHVRVRWDPAHTRLSMLLAALAHVGYPSAPEHSLQAAQVRRREARSALKRLGLAALAMMQVMMLALPVYLSEDGVAYEQASLLSWASLVMTVPVMLYSAWPFFSGAVRDLMQRRLGMDVPAALGLAIAFAASAWETFAGGGAVYYDSITMFVCFVLAGRYFEMKARQRALSAAETLRETQSPFCRRLAAFPKAEGHVVPSATLVAGDHVEVAAGETFPADGRIVRGKTSACEALLTGEAEGVVKDAGSVVFAGTVNQGATVVVAVEAVGENTRLAGIVRQLDAALANKPRLALVADRVAGKFVAALLGIAALTAAAWWIIDPARALPITVAVLVVSCPCALSLATPAALSAAMAALARRGVLVFRGQALEVLARATHVVFDKTGTLTAGRLSVTQTITYRDLSPQQSLDIAAALESDSQHPLGQALRRATGGAPSLFVEEHGYLAGEGVSGRIAGRCYRLGRPAYVAQLHGQAVPEFDAAQDPSSIAALGDERGWIALFLLRDTLRQDAAQLVHDLAARGVAVSLYSGDRVEAVRYWANALGIADWRAAMTPGAKCEAVKALQARGEVVVMIGDGANDSPALGQAQASVALATGAAIAHTGADIVVVGEALAPIALALGTARRTLGIVMQNLAWAAGYNIVCIPLAMTGYLTPWLAGLGMSLSSLLVVGNALRLVRAGRPAHTPVMLAAEAA